MLYFEIYYLEWKLKQHVYEFLSNERTGILQARAKNVFLTISKTYDEYYNPFYRKVLTPKNYPAEFEVAKIIADNHKISLKRLYVHDVLQINGACSYGTRANPVPFIMISKGALEGTEKDFLNTFTHELGHLKYAKMHSKLGFGEFRSLYHLFLLSTTILYGLGNILSTLDISNLFLSIAESLLPVTATLVCANAICTRTKEFMADIFAYNATGIFPSDFTKEKRKGIVGNSSKIFADIVDLFVSGYPTWLERDAMCKIFGKKNSVDYVSLLEVKRNSKSKKNHNQLTVN